MSLIPSIKPVRIFGYKACIEFLDKFYRTYMQKSYHSSEVNPVSVLRRFEQQSQAKANKGMNIALYDIANLCSDWPLDKLAHADQLFRASKLLTPSVIIGLHKKRVANIIMQGKVLSEEDAILLQDIIASTRSPSDDRDLIGRILQGYEERHLNKGSV